MSGGKNPTPLWKTLKELFSTGGLPSVFVEGLGWSRGTLPVSQVSVDHDIFLLSPIAELKSYRIIEISGDDIPSPKDQSVIDRKVAEVYPERILVFSDGVTHHWRWPRETPSGGVSFETLTVSASSLPSFLAQRLVGLAFDIAHFRAGITLVDVRNRVRGKFDAAKVTKKFFDAFKVQRTKLAESIVGLGSEEDQSTYSSLLLNRLMLLYFLQKREFLNGDPNYLENCLAGVKDLKGDQQFYGFYRDVLLPMFFERLASHQHAELEPEIENLLGDVPYINGGIYEPSDLEKEHGDSLNVPDEAFVSILAFFGSFNWHLDTRPSGQENEINPEVIGYIFEQYINLTTGGKKDKGAYYTPEDVTGYMVGATLVPRVVDYLVELNIPIFDLVQADPLRYVYPDMLHGFNPEENQWVEAPKELLSCWEGDPIHWHTLDEAEQNPELSLPGETWVEMFYRRERVLTLVPKLREGLISEANDLITYNLNSRLLLTDAIDRIDSAKVAMKLWRNVTSMSVLDPTCGSGAFLFAAMETLEDVYHHLLNVIESIPENSETASLNLEVIKHPNERYFVRKSIALNNLYGTDLMPDAVETAKLRIFLALVSCLESREELEPLPDLDFNLKCGNLLVGLKDADDVERVSDNFVDALFFEELTPEISEFSEKYMRFVELSAEHEGESLIQLKNEMKQLTENLRKKVDGAYLQMDQIDEAAKDGWAERSRPFHWFCEFPLVIDAGGFDVIVGNPPYVQTSSLNAEERRQIRSFETAKVPNLYAQCSERILKLLSRSGRVSLIVMLNLSFGKGFGPLRQVFSDQGSCEWWSTFGNFPEGLFKGADVRNTLITLGPGDGVWATRHHIFNSATRKWMFSGLHYHAIARALDEVPNRGGLASDLISAWPQGELDINSQSGQSLFLKPTGTYWLPVLPSQPHAVLADSSPSSVLEEGLKRVFLDNREERWLVTAGLAGKLGFLWWSALGDNFHTGPENTVPVRVALLSLGEESKSDLRKVATLLENSFHPAIFLSNHKGLRVNIRWSDMAEVTDLFDSELLDCLGLEQYWRPLSIWYRQVMRSSGASKKDKAITIAQAKKLLTR